MRTKSEIFDCLLVLAHALALTEDKMGERILIAAASHLAGLQHKLMPSTVAFWAGEVIS